VPSSRNRAGQSMHVVTEVGAENNSHHGAPDPIRFVTLARTFSQYLSEHAPRKTQDVTA